MRRLAAIAGLMAALALASGQASAFQEQKVPPPEAAASVPAAQPPALKLGTPADGGSAAQADTSGFKLFGYTVLPKLNFGLDVLYGQDEQKSQLQAPNSIDETNDVTVVGKVKRRF